MRAGASRIDCQRAVQQIAGIGNTALRALDQREINQRFDVAAVGTESDAEFRGGLAHLVGAHQRYAKVVVRLHIVRIDGDCPLKLFDRVVLLTAILIQQTEIVVHFGALVVLLQQGAVMRERVVVIADALIVDRQTEMIFSRRQVARR